MPNSCLTRPMFLSCYKTKVNYCSAQVLIVHFCFVHCCLQGIVSVVSLTRLGGRVR